MNCGDGFAWWDLLIFLIVLAIFGTAYNMMIHGKLDDSPNLARTWDIRPLNDAFSDDKLRTAWMLKVHAAYLGSYDWEQTRRRAVAEKLVILTVNRIISDRKSVV